LNNTGLTHMLVCLSVPGLYIRDISAHWLLQCLLCAHRVSTDWRRWSKTAFVLLLTMQRCPSYMFLLQWLPVTWH